MRRMRKTPFEIAEEVKDWKARGADEFCVAALISEWMGEHGTVNLDDTDLTWAQFVHSEIARGQSIKDVRSALDHYYGARVSVCWVVQLCNMDLPAATK